MDIVRGAMRDVLALTEFRAPTVSTVLFLLMVSWQVQLSCWWLVGWNTTVALRWRLIRSNGCQLTHQIRAKVVVAVLTWSLDGAWVLCTPQTEQEARVDSSQIDEI